MLLENYLLVTYLKIHCITLHNSLSLSKAIFCSKKVPSSSQRAPSTLQACCGALELNGKSLNGLRGLGSELHGGQETASTIKSIQQPLTASGPSNHSDDSENIYPRAGCEFSAVQSI